ncbi:MAG: hypothetical protein HYY13_08710 [Nitrospirae bacterium]|nr:hypothetical protein [Nitrospirota bacterium]
MTSFFKKIWDGWKWFAEKLGNFNARIILTVLYVLLVVPTGVLFKTFGRSARPVGSLTNWVPKPPARGEGLHTRQW